MSIAASACLALRTRAASQDTRQPSSPPAPARSAARGVTVERIARSVIVSTACQPPPGAAKTQVKHNPGRADGPGRSFGPLTQPGGIYRRWPAAGHNPEAAGELMQRKAI